MLHEIGASDEPAPATTVGLHLVSAPWAPVPAASNAIAALRAYLSNALPPEQVSIRCHSAFVKIAYDVAGFDSRVIWDGWYPAGEIIYQLLYARRYLGADALGGLTADETLAYVNRRLGRLRREWREWFDKRPVESRDKPLSAELLDRLEDATNRYVDERIMPILLDRSGPVRADVIGFTLTFNQLYSSLFMTRRIEEKLSLAGRAGIECRPRFVYGGYLAGMPSVATLLERLGVEGWLVVGDGEKKLEGFLRDVLAGKDREALGAGIPGVVAIGSVGARSLESSSAARAARIELAELPLPDYSEAFELHDQLSNADPFYRRLNRPPRLALEGTRGCAWKCDFCDVGLNRDHFERMRAEDVYRRLLELERRHGRGEYAFSDSTCDSFAEGLAKLLLDNGVEGIKFTMYMRARHGEAFWAKLAAAGLSECLIGIESFATPLLGHMSKGCTALDNVRSLKYLKELEVRSLSGLILHHPKGTLDDARATLETLKMIPHFDPLNVYRFRLKTGSPIYRALSPEARSALRAPQETCLPPALRPLLAAWDWELPSELEPAPEAAAAWDEVYDHCRDWRRAPGRSRLSVTRHAEGCLRIVDTRSGKERQHELTDLAARVYDFCHGGVALDAVVRGLEGSATEVEIRDELEAFVGEGLIGRIDGHYLSLGLRPREEILRRQGLTPLAAAARIAST